MRKIAQIFVDFSEKLNFKKMFKTGQFLWQFIVQFFSTPGLMVIIEWFGISQFSRTFFKICCSHGDFCLGLPEEGKLINVHYFSDILDF